MQSNHVDHAIHVEHAIQDIVPGETRLIPPDLVPDPAGDRSRSHTDPAVDPADTRWLEGIARRLRPLRAVSGEVLRAQVTGRGVCMAPDPLSWQERAGTGEQSLWESDPPPGLFDSGTDEDLALRLCAGCPVADACTELELRQAGPDTVGVWGALDERDRRALYPMWLRHRRPTAPPTGGGSGSASRTGSGAGAEGGER